MIRRGIIAGLMALVFVLAFHADVFAATKGARLYPGQFVASSVATYSTGGTVFYVKIYNYRDDDVVWYLRNDTTGEILMSGYSEVMGVSRTFSKKATKAGRYRLYLYCAEPYNTCNAYGTMSW